MKMVTTKTTLSSIFQVICCSLRNIGTNIDKNFQEKLFLNEKSIDYIDLYQKRKKVTTNFAHYSNKKLIDYTNLHQKKEKSNHKFCTLLARYLSAFTGKIKSNN